MNCEIRHSTVIAAAPEVVSAALSEPRQLAHWWTREVSLADDLVRLYWSRQGWRVELSIDAGANHQLVCWCCHDSNMRDTDAWKGTVMRFELRPTSQGTQIDFVQSGYRDSPCKEACARGWRFSWASASNAMWKPARARPRPIWPCPKRWSNTRTARAERGSDECWRRSTHWVDRRRQRLALTHSGLSTHRARDEYVRLTKLLRKLPSGRSRPSVSPHRRHLQRCWPSPCIQLAATRSAIVCIAYRAPCNPRLRQRDMRLA